MESDNKIINIEVVYALPNHAYLIPVKVNSGTTLRQGIESSGILEKCPEINLARNKVGIYSKPRALDYVLKDGDRIEIYRPLIIDPKEARRKRANKI